jgi:4-amino-4-deoxy-L-arabinose transferase-like glycosyltransferase
LALFAAGKSSYQILSPLEHHGLFKKISGDRWIQEDATITLPKLLHRGNFLKIKFQDWHPADKPPAHVKISVCGETASELFITPGKEEIVYLKGSCEPREVKFNFYNPFNPSANDNRLVGAQLASVQVSSKLGFPLTNIETLLLAFLAILAIGGVTAHLFNEFSRVVSFGATATLFAFLIGNAQFFRADIWGSAWLTWVIACLGGIALKESNRSKFEPNGRIFPRLMLLVLILGAAIRVWGLNFGIPHIYHPDELQKWRAVMRMVEYGDLNPRYFWHPSLLLYLTYATNSVFHLFSIEGSFADTLILAGRTVSCIAGTISIYLVYKIGSLLWNSRAGFISATLLASFPLAITCSRYLKEDSLLTCIVLTAVLFTVKAAQNGSLSWLLLGGIFAGLSSSVKYSGIISFFILWGYPFICRNSELPFIKRVKHSLLATLIVPIGFLIGTPYSVLDYPTFLNDFNHERAHMLTGHSSVITAGSQYWMFHVKNSLLKGVTSINLLLGIFAFGAILRKFRFPALYLFGLFLLYYLPAEFVRAKPAPQPERYIMPCLPFLALAIAWAYEEVRNLRFQLFFLLAICSGLLISGYRSATLATEILPDTRDQAAIWLTQNIPSSAKVIIDWEQYGPQFKEPPFTVKHLNPETVIVDLAINNLNKEQADYLILSSLHYDRYFSQPNINPGFRTVIRKLFATYPTVVEFEAPHGTFGFHNPKISVLKIK